MPVVFDRFSQAFFNYVPPAVIGSNSCWLGQNLIKYGERRVGVLIDLNKIQLTPFSVDQAYFGYVCTCS